MSIRTRKHGLIFVAAMPWRQMTQRFSFVLFMLLSCGILVFGKIQPATVENIRVHAVDGLAPVLDAIQRPVTAINNLTLYVNSYFSLRSENEKLRADLAQLKEWQNAIVSMQSENRELRNLLHFKAEPGFAYISARIIADTGGPFVRSMVVTAGSVDGVREGMAVMSGDGLVGRVVEVGDWSSRVLLITDLNSRIPVTVSGTSDRAILSGDNSPTPKLLYLPQDSSTVVGALVVTSGHGGVFPPNLPVGIVTDLSHGAYGIEPAADLNRINYVRLVDFNLKGGIFNPIATKIEAQKKKR